MAARTFRHADVGAAETGTPAVITPANYGSVQVSLDAAFGDGRRWWDGRQWQPIPEDARAAAKDLQRAAAATRRSRDSTMALAFAGALYQLGRAEARRGRETQAAAAFQEILTRFSDDLDLALRGYAAAAAVARGNLLARKASRGRSADRVRTLRLALAEYRTAIDRYARDASPGMQVWVAEALVESALVWGSDAINDKASAIVDCDAAMRRLEPHTGPIAERLTAVAAESAASCRRQLGLPAEARSAGSPPPVSPQSYSAVQVSLDASAAEGRLWWNGAEWLPLPVDARAAAQALQTVIAAAGQRVPGSADVALAGALYASGTAHSRLGRESQALSAYDDILRRFSANPDAVLQGYVAAAMCAKGRVFAAVAGRTPPQHPSPAARQALGEFRAVIDRYAGDPNPGFQVWVATAMVESGRLFGSDAVNDRAMAVVYSDAAAHLLRTHTGTPAARVAAAAGLNAGFFLAQLGLRADAISVTRDMVSRFADAVDPTIGGCVAAARNHVATWESPGHPTGSPAAVTSRPKRSANAAVAAVAVLLVITGIAIVALPGFVKTLNRTPGGSPGSGSTGYLSLGGGSTGSGGSAGSTGPAGDPGTVVGPLGITGTKPAWISLSYSCECPPTDIKSFTPDRFHGELCPPSAFKFGFDKNGGYDMVYGGCSRSSDWSVCAVAGSDSGIIPTCAVDSSQSRAFADLVVGATNDVGGAALTGTGRPLDLVIYYCGSGDSLEGYPTFPSVECVGG